MDGDGTPNADDNSPTGADGNSDGTTNGGDGNSDGTTNGGDGNSDGTTDGGDGNNDGTGNGDTSPPAPTSVALSVLAKSGDAVPGQPSGVTFPPRSATPSSTPRAGSRSGASTRVAARRATAGFMSTTEAQWRRSSITIPTVPESCPAAVRLTISNTTPMGRTSRGAPATVCCSARRSCRLREAART